MSEPWLQPNRRALWFACTVLLLLALAGGLIVYVSTLTTIAWLRWIGIVLIALGVLGAAILLPQFRQPRIAYEAGKVLFRLRAGEPIAVPADIVEAFFVGQGPAGLPGKVASREKSLNLVARLSQRETSWAEREVKPALGEWKEGYITIHGAWCEPLTTEVIRRLNRRLKEVKQSRRHDGPASPTAPST